MKLVFLTSKSITKVISLLVVSMFMLVQFAAASHTHEHEEHSPEPNVCVMCLTVAQDDDGDFDLEPTSPTTLQVPNTLDSGSLELSDGTFALNRDDVNIVWPPDLRLSPPRAPPTAT